MSDVESENGETQPKRRRHVSNQANYKRNIVRNARVKGESYVSYSGKEVPQKNRPAILTCKCSLKCAQIISHETIEGVWTYFYSIDTKNAQDTYLQTLIESKEISRRRKKPEQNPDPNDQDVTHEESFKRNCSYVYNVKVKGQLKNVCKNVFMQMHGITHNRLGRICQLLASNKTPKDLRGFNRSGNAIPGNICVLIHDQISKFEVKETHYGSNHVKYLDARLNLKSMFEMFIKDHPRLENVVKYNFYYTYFRENFGLRFGRPQVDVCSQCENLKCKLKDRALNDNAKRAVAAELVVHKRRAGKFYTGIKNSAKMEAEDTVSLCFDYMQNLPLPNIPVQEIFYMRQLWVNVFSIHDPKTRKSKIYIYHEGEANKSPNEVCSFLLDYINTEVPPTVRKLILFSDGPSGQNKNHTVVRFLMNLCDRDRFDSIVHNFPVRGHSFSPCDRDFGAIKRLVKMVDRIYTPEEYTELILRASKTHRFTVQKVTPELILNFKEWWPRYYKKITVSDETSGRNVQKDDKVTFKVSTFKQFCYNKDTPGKVVAKQHIDGVLQSTFTLLKVNQAPSLPTETAYPAGKVPIHVKKVADLKKLKDYLIGYEDFYNPIFEWPTSDAECNVEYIYE